MLADVVHSEEQEGAGSDVVEVDIGEVEEVGSGRERHDGGGHFGESMVGVQGLAGDEVEVCDKEQFVDVG